MSFFRTGPGVLIVLLLAVAVTAMAAVGFQVYRVTHPPRHDDDPIALASAVVPFEDVRFPAADGVELDGWILRGDPDQVVRIPIGVGVDQQLDVVDFLRGLNGIAPPMG